LQQFGAECLDLLIDRDFPPAPAVFGDVEIVTACALVVGEVQGREDGEQFALAERGPTSSNL